jgi:hypothetical protein
MILVFPAESGLLKRMIIHPFLISGGVFPATFWLYTINTMSFPGPGWAW